LLTELTAPGIWLALSVIVGRFLKYQSPLSKSCQATVGETAAHRGMINISHHRSRYRYTYRVFFLAAVTIQGTLCFCGVQDHETVSSEPPLICRWCGTSQRQGGLVPASEPALAAETVIEPRAFDDLPIESGSVSANIRRSTKESGEEGVQWSTLLKASSLYLAIMHSFRIATEPSTRKALDNSAVGGYFKELGAMHGWSDGDSYYENYLGHPIEGAVSGYIWPHNEVRYRAVRFGRERPYWISRLRAYAFSWAFSEQFEIGPISEASIGQIQRYCCAYGFVDHVITPNGGMAWMIAGDALDRFVTVPIENRTRNIAARIFARTALNPAQAFANLISLQYP